MNRDIKINDKPIQERYDNILHIHKTEVKKTNKQTERTLSLETKQFIKERKELIHKGKNKQTRHKISELSKKINEHIRKDLKVKRQNTIKTFIEKTGGMKKALKELNQKKIWMPNIKTKNGNSTSKRQEILKIATEYYRILYQRQATALVEKQKEITIDLESAPIILQEETTKAINTQKLDKAPGSDQISNELLKYTIPFIQSESIRLDASDANSEML
ncbi:Endonuclease-reverse transcriptase [Operophtera brumata]|uniref:Endonuclease-reverse transcriptase n=1 Tax=Operophtera brumata TaxID=104452 RepID=A0A0L7K3E2_OPEBR|nr:Endonuclease-reverse transcriptase [Operophtera brumata]